MTLSIYDSVIFLCLCYNIINTLFEEESMKLTIEQSDIFTETEINIKCNMIDSNLQKIIDELQIMMFSITAYKDGAIYKISLDDIYYFESVDDKTFIYCQVDVYECKYKLYELENKISNYKFTRISKSAIINIDKISYIKPQLAGRLDITMDNGEHQTVNRHYVNTLRMKFEGEV